LSHIDRRLSGPRRQPDPELALFHAARRASHLAFVQWLATNPDVADIDLEVDGSAAILRQLASFARSGWSS
jgi:hypothetical protein